MSFKVGYHLERVCLILSGLKNSEDGFQFCKKLKILKIDYLDEYTVAEDARNVYEILYLIISYSQNLVSLEIKAGSHLILKPLMFRVKKKSKIDLSQMN